MLPDLLEYLNYPELFKNRFVSKLKYIEELIIKMQYFPYLTKSRVFHA